MLRAISGAEPLVVENLGIVRALKTTSSRPTTLSGIEIFKLRPGTNG